MGCYRDAKYIHDSSHDSGRGIGHFTLQLSNHNNEYLVSEKHNGKHINKCTLRL